MIIVWSGFGGCLGAGVLDLDARPCVFFVAVVLLVVFDIVIVFGYEKIYDIALREPQDTVRLYCVGMFSMVILPSAM